MALRTAAGLLFVFLLRFGGMGAERHYFFSAGGKATVPCERAVHYGPRCSEVIWFYFYKEYSVGVIRVQRGRVEGPGSSRVSLAPNCSLTIHNVTDEDTGKYVCRLSDQDPWDTTVYLGVLKVSEAPPGSDHDASLLTLQCSVSRYSRECRSGSILWSDHRGNITANVRQTNCVSSLTVERRPTRTFTCRYLTAKSKVLISADYTPGVRSVHIHHFSRAGENSTLPCEILSHHGPSCSAVNWYYLKTRSSPIIPKVSEGNVKDSRLTLNPDCSLSVQKVSKEDSGLFLCQQTGVVGSDTVVFLSVLTVSPAPPEPKSPNFTLHCKLWRFNERDCSDGTFVWLDQNQEVLSGEQRNCESELTVELQSPQTRTFTCQYQENGRVQVSAEYSLRGEEERVQPEKGWSWFLLLKTLGWTPLIITTVVVSICTRDAQRPKSNRKRVPDYENETNL